MGELTSNAECRLVFRYYIVCYANLGVVQIYSGLTGIVVLKRAWYTLYSEVKFSALIHRSVHKDIFPLMRMELQLGLL